MPESPIFDRTLSKKTIKTASGFFALRKDSIYLDTPTLTEFRNGRPKMQDMCVNIVLDD